MRRPDAPPPFILKRLVPSAKKRLYALVSRGDFVLRRRSGAVFLLNPANFVDRQILFYDDFEQAQKQVFMEQIRKHDCDLFVDVGANLGYYSILLALAVPNLEIVVFEPDRRNRLQMGANMFMNGVADRITLLDKAVSDRSGTVSFVPAAATSTGQSKVAEGPGAVSIPAVALDDALPVSGRRIAVKMDIEGFEAVAVRGMRRLIAENQVVMQVECFEHNHAALDEQMRAMGMRLLRSIDEDRYYTSSVNW
ncbi:methyltransferase FkbM family [Caenispirillum salinarum AK4]|uniref:Methyltransferase FkbM family n=1 Tax=Caenispirillum salinarum AK4 TaxID=1238182 RepID=K9H9V8_9PROT|nr:FkbM family methyltransferase [Caenispirillum salinarum]EKV27403.1 methyltransferase FkbM family [Caenispirillum salinarum AK4]